MEEIEGILEHITFHSPQTGFSVVKLRVRRQAELVVATGNMAGLSVGETLLCRGVWSRHNRFGTQFKVHNYQTSLPATVGGIERYLGSGLIKGVGPKTARRLVATFHTEIFDIIENAHDRLLEVPGLGPKRAGRIRQGWADHREIQNVMVFLQGHEVSPTFAIKIYKTYRDQAIKIVRENPYRLAEDIWGIGFKTADRIARALGLAEDSPERIRAGITHVLGEATDDGHVFLPEDDLIGAATALLAVGSEAVLEGIEAQIAQGRVIKETRQEDGANCLFLAALAYAERGVAARFLELARDRCTVTQEAAKHALEAVRDGSIVSLSEEQGEAVKAALASRILVLTGGPGTGKSTTCNTILTAFERMGKSCILASPTGRAAKRLAEITGRPAKTVHRLLEFDPREMTFKRGPDDPLRADVFMFDEVSMLDLPLTNSLLKALPAGAQVVLVGDSDQLPSVGPGSVLRDLLASGAVPVARLTHIFRQAQASLIVTNAHRINAGKYPRLLPPKVENRNENAFFIEADKAEDVIATILDLLVRRLPSKGFAADDIQVLCPMNRGSAGASALGTAIQAAVNPPNAHKTVIAHGARQFQESDRVIQLKNNYQLDVFNGDIGKIQTIDPEDQVVSVAFGERSVRYDFADLDQLGLAYALSVHKSQGSEYPVVIVPIITQHYPMLQRNLFYTAVTRARTLLILVGSLRAVGIAVRNDQIATRHSLLAERMSKGLPVVRAES